MHKNKLTKSPQYAPIRCWQCNTPMHPIPHGCSRQDRGVRVEVKFATPHSKIPWVVHGGPKQALERVRSGVFKHDSCQRRRKHIEDEGLSILFNGQSQRLVV